MRNVTVDYRQIANDDMANQIHGFTIDYGKFILKLDYVLEISMNQYSVSFEELSADSCPAEI